MQAIKTLMYTPQEIKLAHELAEGLEDFASLSFYLTCTKKYSHRSLRAVLQHVSSLPKESIRNSRGALFTHIISQTPHDPNDDETERYDDSWH